MSVSKIGWLCRICRVRWAQRKGLCRQCGKGMPVKSVEAERESARMLEAIIERSGNAEPMDLGPRDPIRTATYGGNQYDVMWDGTR